MSQPSVKQFVQRIQRSQLVPREQLRSDLLALKRQRNGVLPSSVLEIAKYLIRVQTLTRWQCEKLLAGKSRGFFLGHHRLLDHICTGGMSSVYLAEDVEQRQLRAIKVFPKSRLGRASYLERFHLEADATLSLDHPHVVQAFGIERQEDTYYLVMEYVHGRDLQVLVSEDGPLEYRLAADYIAQAAVGLEYAHLRGLVHRDVKPANLLVSKQGVIKILDLGLVLWSDHESSLTLAHDEKVLGTADYLAPEQALDSHHVDCRADIYGLGCTLYFALTARAPFQQGSVAQRILMHQTRMPAPISEDRADCPAALQRICIKMLQKQPDRRFQSCAEVASALQSWIASQRAAPRRLVPAVAHALSPPGVESGGPAADAGDASIERPATPGRRRVRTPSERRTTRPGGPRSDDTLSNAATDTLVSRKKADPRSNTARRSNQEDRASSQLETRRIAWPVWGAAALVLLGAVAGLMRFLL